ncbi:type II toxin-antitoxin system HicB family antitoxin, partial [Enterobacter hormaechei]
NQAFHAVNCRITHCHRQTFRIKPPDIKPEKNMTITRRFSVGIESPADTDTAWGIYVPAFDVTGYGCVSAADTQEGTEAAAREAILAMTTYMLAAGGDLRALRDAGTAEYRNHADYRHCDQWLVIDTELPE